MTPPGATPAAEALARALLQALAAADPAGAPLPRLVKQLGVSASVLLRAAHGVAGVRVWQDEAQGRWMLALTGGTPAD
ncbi:hypothetical protein SAMN05428957_103226 [Oryzisolibacter propanilivorax]|uniref:FdhD protein n=1 Tax=Oryzisolibacter propanilivorax TaxID=1527607 RepID=A0A1G9RER4_9BURK|nr:hypothetical protein [Oryzisolibacter propanilivorax]SDM21724.1 hypothetical protein SAMN05428957_103226 [Oryzisolibacter propanilivorax]